MPSSQAPQLSPSNTVTNMTLSHDGLGRRSLPKHWRSETPFSNLIPVGVRTASLLIPRRAPGLRWGVHHGQKHRQGQPSCLPSGTFLITAPGRVQLQTGPLSPLPSKYNFPGSSSKSQKAPREANV